MLQFDKKQIPKQAKDKKHFGNIVGDSGLFVIEELLRHHSGPVLVITENISAANLLENALNVLLQDQYPVISFPDWEILPYDQFSPHRDILSQRLATLYQLPRLQQGVVISSITTLLYQLMPQRVLEAHSLMIKAGQNLERESFCDHLVAIGYRPTETVIEHGEFAKRGSLLDVFPMGHDKPLRIDLFDEEVDSLREFDPDTQRTIRQIDSLQLMPAHECLVMEPYITNFRRQWRQHFEGNPKAYTVYQQVSEGQTASGIESYLPLFFEQTATIFDYLPQNTLIIHYNPLHQPAINFWQETEKRFEQYRHDVQNPILSPDKLFIRPNGFFERAKQFPQIEFHEKQLEPKSAHFNMPFARLPAIASPARQTQLFQPFINYLQQSSRSVLLAAESQGRRQLLLDQIRSLGIEAETVESWREFSPDNQHLALTVLPLQAGFEVNDRLYSFVAEADLFEEHELVPRRRRQQGPEPDKLIKSLGELQIGEAVVHINHGIGRYRGLRVIETDGSANEYLTIEYANNDKVYVPVSQLNLVTRFSSTDADNAPLHQLGSKQWDKAKRRAAQKVRDAAAELLDIYAKRQARQGIQCQKPDADYYAFANDFPFTETPDQKRAIEQVINDMTRPSPMDRLVCGDVGFGKTEVAMRAAFLAVQSGWQVAVLVPTTLLAEQHYQTFIDRFSNWPVKIEQLSRFQSTKEQSRVHKELQSGHTDIVIGTHILLQKQTSIDHLGLLVVDEEHRFGVRQKERIKSWRSVVDVLAMTATPIPRTLNMSFSQIRDLSIIATPPEKRLAVKTFVKPFDKDIIREAALREIMRGGQLYFLHNEVATIDKMTQELTELLPQARISLAHGQMRERQLERVMSDFYHRRTNVLVCTSIIESGIDVPTANTIIINRAERFGLAQLHQLRGRVGRSHHQAYAYLLTSGDKPPTPEAEKRLQAIEQLEDLGAGFSLATQDLEIRGAGELLGEEQSGQMEAVGFELYQEMLDKAVNDIKEGKEPQLEKPVEQSTEINASVSALIPQDFIPDIHTRLSLYKRLANVANDRELDHFYQEMMDRFGPLPQATLNLITQNRLRLMAMALGINKIDIGNESGVCEFTDNPDIDPKRLIELIQQYPAWYQLKDQHRLKFAVAEDDPYDSIKKLLEALT